MMQRKLSKKLEKKGAIKKFKFLTDLAIVINNTMPVPEEPKTFNQAWDHPKKNSCKKWPEVIRKEFVDMNKQKVWCMTHKSLITTNCMCVKTSGS